MKNKLDLFLIGNLHFSVTDAQLRCRGNQICNDKNTQRWYSVEVKTKQYASKTPRVNSAHTLGGLESSFSKKKGKEVGGRHRSSFSFSSSPMTFFSFLLSSSSPGALSLPTHLSPFAHDLYREVSSNKPQLLRLKMFRQLPKDLADHCMGDPINSINVFILKKRCTFNQKPCFSFVCIFCKKEKETKNWGGAGNARAHLCMSVLSSNHLFVTCKQETGKSLPLENPQGLEHVVGLVFWLALLACWLNGERD